MIDCLLLITNVNLASLLRSNRNNEKLYELGI
ncbi:hypothetical protein Cycma_0906 [Cyclobacterium marinum DSM 745]|uniref:Uncharacterized protein n=1 Tax=Cyclobacterium marinum (strain ATCC 25205 / DSM 745 / LMG 13164 / NCIMB 1802) TaxID=880070 RepID=G0J4L3_CYCMS|nr:hypothetical protein Cycma_0906 [Cyclobacterium marinum DSM 745]